MKSVEEMSPKEADAFKGASMDQILEAMVILEYELHKISLIRRSMMATGSKVFLPEEHGIKKYIPHMPGE